MAFRGPDARLLRRHVDRRPDLGEELGRTTRSARACRQQCGRVDLFCDPRDLWDRHRPHRNGDLGGYPPPVQGELRRLLVRYTHTVIEREWPEQHRGLIPSEGTDVLTEL